jgi:uncharacterized membrane protein (UPF0127 family)
LKRLQIIASALALLGAVTAYSLQSLSNNPDRINQLSQLQVVNLRAAGNVVHAWVMDNESKRQEGMMFLTARDVKEDQGMIFVFPEIQRVANNSSFWMHNCPLGLDIIYIDANHRVVNVGDGKPETDTAVAPLRDYEYVLEVRRGWAKRHGLKGGARIGIPPGLTTTR